MAKTLKEVFAEVISSEENKKKYASLKSIDEVTAFVRELGGDASADEIKAFVKEMRSGELSDDDLKQVAGGKNEPDHPTDFTTSCDPW